MNKAPAYKRERAMATIENPIEPAAVPLRQVEPSIPKAGLFRSFCFAAEGFQHVLATQRNFRIQLAAAMSAIAAGIYFHLSTGEWCAVILASVIVLVLEMVNTALETSIDLVTQAYHPLAKNAKDIAAGAVLLASVGALGIAALVFTPHVLAIFSQK